MTVESEIKSAILAANAEVRAYWEARPPSPFSWDDSKPIIQQMELANAAVKAHRAQFDRSEVDAIWRKHGFVPCENATGMRYAG